MALKIVGSSPIIHPIKNKHPFRVLIFYGIRWIMGLEESGPPVRAGKKVSGGHFFSSGESPVCRTGGKQQAERENNLLDSPDEINLSGDIHIKNVVGVTDGVSVSRNLRDIDRNCIFRMWFYLECIRYHTIQ